MSTPLPSTTSHSSPLSCPQVGFLYENLWDARKKYDKHSFASIWIVFLTNIIAGELQPQYGLLIAIIVGIILSLGGFAYEFVHKSLLAPPISGEEHCSTAVRSAAQEVKLGVLGRWYHIFTAQATAATIRPHAAAIL